MDAEVQAKECIYNGWDMFGTRSQGGFTSNTWEMDMGFASQELIQWLGSLACRGR